MTPEASFVIELATVATQELRKMPPGDAAHLRGPILSLATEPRPPGAVKIASTTFWRLRVGHLRVVSLVDPERLRVVVLRVARRSESSYRRLRR